MGKKTMTKIQDNVFVGFLFSIKIVLSTPKYKKTIGIQYHCFKKLRSSCVNSIYSPKFNKIVLLHELNDNKFTLRIVKRTTISYKKRYNCTLPVTKPLQKKDRFKKT